MALNYCGGTYTFTYSTASGCDSIVHIELNVLALPVVDVWMDASGYCMDAGWQAVGMDPVEVYWWNRYLADGFDPMLAGAGGPGRHLVYLHGCFRMC